MQNAEGFRKYLKRGGKQDHIVEDLVKQCGFFEEFLHRTLKIGIDEANEEHIRAFYDVIKNEKKNVGNRLRAISLYYRFASKPELSAFSSNLREGGISSTRRPFEFRSFRGVRAEYVRLLEREGIVTVDQMLERGKTPQYRKGLSKKTGIPLKSILEYVKLSDLSRLGSIKSMRARLYFDAGVDTPDKMASWNPKELRETLISHIDKTGFNGIAPLPKEAKNAVEDAKKMPKIIEY